jgi:hypothetical protein
MHCPHYYKPQSGLRTAPQKYLLLYDTWALGMKPWSAQAMLAPWEPAAMLRAACGQSMALPVKSGSTAPALQMTEA